MDALVEISTMMSILAAVASIAVAYRHFSGRSPRASHIAFASFVAIATVVSLTLSVFSSDRQDQSVEKGQRTSDLVQGSRAEFLAQAFVLPREKPMVQAVGYGLAAVLVKRNTPKVVDLCRAVMAYRGYGSERFNPRLVTIIDGQRYRMRPIYWFVTNMAGAELTADDVCPIAVQRYDYDRAEAIIKRLKLEGSGPFLTVAGFGNGSGFALRTYVLENIPPDEFDESITSMVIYFRGSLERMPNVYANKRQIVKSYILNSSIDIPAIFGFSTAEAKQ